MDLSLSLVGSVVVTNTKLGEDIFVPSSDMSDGNLFGLFSLPWSISLVR